MNAFESAEKNRRADELRRELGSAVHGAGPGLQARRRASIPATFLRVTVAR